MNKEKEPRLHWVTDSGHAWLAVPLALLSKVGCAKEISSFSYMTPTTCYLEEDCDASVFLRAAEALDIHPKISEGRHSDRSRVRDYASFDFLWVEQPLVTGSPVVLSNGERASVMENGISQIYLSSETGRTYRSSPEKVLACVWHPERVLIDAAKKEMEVRAKDIGAVPQSHFWPELGSTLEVVAANERSALVKAPTGEFSILGVDKHGPMKVGVGVTVGEDWPGITRSAEPTKTSRQPQERSMGPSRSM